MGRPLTFEKQLLLDISLEEMDAYNTANKINANVRFGLYDYLKDLSQEEFDYITTRLRYRNEICYTKCFDCIRNAQIFIESRDKEKINTFENVKDRKSSALDAFNRKSGGMMIMRIGFPIEGEEFGHDAD